ncbi:MAG: DUF1552 domain-containing protein, partial [Nitrososphaeraceae archaeon]|nr:DUF1552 domain-containing protein [Nitrososphaeraceae archaeon]
MKKKYILYGFLYVMLCLFISLIIFDTFFYTPIQTKKCYDIVQTKQVPKYYGFESNYTLDVNGENVSIEFSKTGEETESRMSRSTRISRRTVLRGLGATISLPLLEAMLPATSRAAGAQGAKPPVRMAFLYVPNGMHMPAWTPADTGEQFELPPTLQPLATYK